MVLFKRFGFMALLLFAGFTQAKELGNFGRTIEIAESNLLEDIKRYVASNDFALRQQAFVEKAQARVKTPKPVLGVKKATQSRTFYFDPSFTLTRDLSDHEGSVFARAGTTVNPLEKVFFKGLLFFDGDDPMQINWVQEQIQDNQIQGKLVLIRGNPDRLSRTLGLPVFFDQSGRLVKKFGIRQVPACIEQAGSRLKIQEILLDEDGKVVRSDG